MPRRCKQSGQREELGESWGESLADDDEEVEHALNRSSRAAETARDLTTMLSVHLVSLRRAQSENDAIGAARDLLPRREVPRFARNDKSMIAGSEVERTI